MKILYILPEFPPGFGGGIATVYGQLLPMLDAEGHHITVLLASQDCLDQASYSWQGIAVVPLRSEHLSQAKEEMKVWRQHSFLYSFLPVAWAAWNQASTMGDYDVVEVTDWALLFVPWLVQARRQPVVVSLHGSCGQVDWHGNPGCRDGEGQLVRLLESASLPLADCLIANSIINADSWRQECGVVSQVIPPVFEHSSFPTQTSQSNPPHIGGGRRSHGLVVGRLQNWKGPELLCQALRLIPDLQIDWIGQDTLWEESNRYTSTYLRETFPDVLDHQLHFLGPISPDEVRKKISEAAFLCIPSLWDVFNVTSLEAISAGTPVICSSKAGASMLFKHQVSGYLFDSTSASSLAQRLQSMQQSSEVTKDVMVQTARSHVNHLVTSTQPVKCYSRLYSDVVESFTPVLPSEWLASFIRHGQHPAQIQRSPFGARIVSAIRRGYAKLVSNRTNFLAR